MGVMRIPSITPTVGSSLVLMHRPTLYQKCTSLARQETHSCLAAAALEAFRHCCAKSCRSYGCHSSVPNNFWEERNEGNHVHVPCRNKPLQEFYKSSTVEKFIRKMDTVIKNLYAEPAAFVTRRKRSRSMQY